MENITGIGSIKTIVAQISISAEELQELINSSELRLALSHAPPQENCTHPNGKLECVYFFSVEYFGIIVRR